MIILAGLEGQVDRIGGGSSVNTCVNYKEYTFFFLSSNVLPCVI